MANIILIPLKIIFSGIIFIGLPIHLPAQKIYKNEIKLNIDNDSFQFELTDRYYSSGVFLSYRRLGNKTTAEKKIWSFRIGQEIYTPYSSFSPIKELHDRPFAGYLFVEVGDNLFFENNALWTRAIQLGVVGPLSLAENAQESLHKLYRTSNVSGWDYQIENTLGLQLNTAYIKGIAPLSSSRLEISGYGNVNAGTINTEASLGVLARIGGLRLQPISQSNFFGGSLGERSKNELYFFLFPKIKYVVYKATIEGGLFDNNSPVTFNSEPFQFQIQCGVNAKINRFNLGYTLIYVTDEVDNFMKHNHSYGRFTVSYLF